MKLKEIVLASLLLLTPSCDYKSPTPAPSRNQHQASPASSLFLYLTMTPPVGSSALKNKFSYAGQEYLLSTERSNNVPVLVIEQFPNTNESLRYKDIGANGELDEIMFGCRTITKGYGYQPLPKTLMAQDKFDDALAEVFKAIARKPNTKN